jgi:hypothetical protein
VLNELQMAVAQLPRHVVLERPLPARSHQLLIAGFGAAEILAGVVGARSQPRKITDGIAYR